MSKKRNIVLFIATSLDGYIATNDEKLDWLFEVEGEGDNGISDFYQTVDTVLMGRRTYDWISQDDHIVEYPYKDKQSYVFTRSRVEKNEHVQFIQQDIEGFIYQLKSEPGKDIWLIGGGELLTSFLEKELVDEIIMTVAPKIIGEGIPLFNRGKHRLNLSLEGVQTFNQFVELHYTVQKGGE
ncbi:hypothetical protein CR194_04925 [Salipaludibacillus keqinensis]|uniref:Bacterial bifunctional deaminase-reductase C-terminal domain-containing protein n=1 Tax=Salipaludibacillus keqinensis TaxID=2045207 RepID=A0A323TIX0_9BACI|nr:dihydrofolate reductase family protein [Salipaludibacillus keqinensis]PYZ94871.1 hypothetical protein CR194_04925 [Salipaludibacillus keqinensis]